LAIGEEKSMKKVWMAGVLVGAGFLFSVAQAQVKQDMKNAGHDTAEATKVAAHDTAHGTKVAARDTEHGTKVAAHDTAHETRHVAHKTAHGTRKVAHKVEGKPEDHPQH
jgi:hypothetical protein